MELSLAEVRQAISAEWLGASAALGLRARGWSIDSRTVAVGDVFFAIQGDRFDGHALRQNRTGARRTSRCRQ